MAHVANRDIDLTTLTLVSWWAFCTAAAVSLLTLAALAGPQQLWPLAWRLAVVLGLILLVCAVVLRSREHYADLRASTANVAAGDLAFLPAAHPDRRTGQLLRQRPAAFLNHPPTRAR